MIEVNNLTRFKFDKKKLAEVAERVLRKENKEEVDLSIVIIGEKEIKNLNRKYRKINRPADVLSFVFKNSGEVILCPSVIKENSKKYSEIFQKEFYRVLIHGILHILGYDHVKNNKQKEKMFQKQEKYLLKI